MAVFVTFFGRVSTARKRCQRTEPQFQRARTVAGYGVDSRPALSALDSPGRMSPMFCARRKSPIQRSRHEFKRPKKESMGAKGPIDTNDVQRTSDRAQHRGRGVSR